MNPDVINRNIFFSHEDIKIIKEIISGLGFVFNQTALEQVLNQNIIFEHDKQMIRDKNNWNLKILTLLLSLLELNLESKNIPSEQSIKTQKKSSSNVKEPQPIDIDDNDDKFYEDPIIYSQIENGKNYTIHIKPENALKIVSVSSFRRNVRDARFAEYITGLLCDIANIRQELGNEWGIRIYVDANNLRRNMVPRDLSFGKFEDAYGKSSWQKLFIGDDGFIDEGIIYAKLYKVLNMLDYVGVYKVELNQEFVDENGYPYDLLPTNYRYHASCDVNKDVVIVKNQAWHVADFIDTNKSKSWIEKFVGSDKKVTYLLMPWYKPKQCLSNDPYAIIAYYFGTKPKQIINFNYSLDSILDFIRSYDVNQHNFLGRNTSRNMMAGRNIYGGDEIVLNDHLFTTFETKDVLPIAHWNVRHKLLIFYILYYTYFNDRLKSEFLADAQHYFDELKLQQVIESTTNDLNEKINQFDYTTLETFLFGDSEKNIVVFYHWLIRLKIAY